MNKSVLLSIIIGILIIIIELLEYYFISSINNSQVYRFEYPTYLILLHYTLIIFILYIIYVYRKSILLNKYSKLDNKLFYENINKNANKSGLIKVFLILFLLKMGVFYMANLQIGDELSSEKTLGIETVFCIDISNSMNALDIDKNISRLNIAKINTERIINKFPNNKIGIVIFAGTSHRLVPLTNDIDFLLNELSMINTDMMSNQGTNFEIALENSLFMFNNNNINKAIIILSDGENHNKNYSSILKKVKMKNIKIFSIGIGTNKKSPIPIIDNNDKSQYIRDKNGNVVLTSLIEEDLLVLAKNSNGNYYKIDKVNSDLNPLFNEINKIEKESFIKKIYESYRDKSQVFLIIMTILMLLILTFTSIPYITKK